MNILVTGGKGQLGRSIEKVAGEFPNHRFVFTDLPEADITDRECMRRLITDNKAGAVINCAAYTAVDRAEEEEAEAARINAEGAAALAQVCRECGVKLVHISTDYVFDGSAHNPIKESDKPSPQSVYGRTKLRGEAYIKESGAAAAVIRTAWLYSEFGNNFVKTMLRLAQEKDEIGVVADQYGTPTYAPDLARAIMKIISGGIKGYSVYHFTDEGETSWWEFASEIFAMAGMATTVRPLTTEQYPTKARRPAYSVLDKSKIKHAGVFVPEWQESLRECLAALGLKVAQPEEF